MSADPIGTRIARAMLRAAVPVAFTALAAASGYALAILGTRYHVYESTQTETAGSIIQAEDQRRATGRAYHDPAGAARDLDRYSWSVPTVLTPFVVAAPRPGRHHNASINQLQFRAGREIERPRPPGRFRILVTGASVAFGSGAPSDDRTIGGYLQSLLDGRAAPEAGVYEVFTLASPGWSSTHERIAIENLLSELEPSVVISITGVGDVLLGISGKDVLWARARSDQFYWDLVNTSLRSAGLEPMVDVEQKAERMVRPAVVARRAAKNARLAAYALSLESAPYYLFLQPMVLTTRKPLSARERSFRGRNTPEVADYIGLAYRALDEQIGKIAAENLRYRNLEGVFDHLSEDEEIFVDQFHFGDKGNEIIARFIADAIAAELR